MLDKRLDIIYNNKSKVRGSLRSMTLEFGEAVKVIEGHIEILKQNLLFSMAERNQKKYYSNHHSQERTG
jgi:hypothetical protein